MMRAAENFSSSEGCTEIPKNENERTASLRFWPKKMVYIAASTEKVTMTHAQRWKRM